jgi:hypothetical protein
MPRTLGFSDILLLIYRLDPMLEVIVYSNSIRVAFRQQNLYNCSPHLELFVG